MYNKYSRLTEIHRQQVPCWKTGKRDWIDLVRSRPWGFKRECVTVATMSKTSLEWVRGTAPAPKGVLQLAPR
jgi:hypothetical protein